MSRITITVSKVVTLEGDSVDTLDAQGVLSWFGFSGDTELSLTVDGVEVTPNQTLGGMTVLAVEDGGAMHVSGERPSGSDWPR